MTHTTARRPLPAAPGRRPITTRLLCLATATAAALALSTPVHADPGDHTPDLSDVGTLVDEIVNAQLAAGEVPGAAVSIVAAGQEVYSAGYGYADIDAKTSVDPDKTGFYTASTAKLFTAASVLQLADAGKLALDADVNDYLTGFQIDDTYPGKPITLEHLLTHTSGFDPDAGMIGTSVNDAKDLTTLADSLQQEQPERVHEPGTVLAYDNYGVALAGLIVEEVSGVPYDEYINEHIYNALGMDDSTASQPHPAAIDQNLALGYRPGGDGQTLTAGQYNPWSPTGPGQVTTAADMGRFMIDQLSGESVLGEGIAERMQQQHYAQDDRMPGMGYIYEERPHNGLRTLFKGGDGSGFHNDMILLPEQQVGIFIATNGDGNGDFDDGALSDAIIDKYFPPTTPLEAPQAIDDNPVDQYAGTYQTSRLSHNGIIKARALAQTVVVVTANSDGTLTTTDRTLSTNPDADSQDWVQIDTGLFQETDGYGLIAFDDNGTLTESRSQNQVYLKLAWYDSPALHQIAVLVGLLGLIIGAFAIPVTALVRRVKERPRHSRGARAARLLAWITAILATVLIVGIGALLGDQDAAIELMTLGSPILLALMVLATVTVLASAGVFVAAVIAWWRGWWRVPGRLFYTLLALCGVMFSAVIVTYNVVGPPFD